ncbi:hypothetical protein NXS98_04625 [Fontisphaera persica]|uniref:hypothetical protein n=1 Tax=Fontisphaera persica TaxID=2974023 RepID=UPI0024C02687|nr:hypothetical protein [Fontisphaera persica]WCJ60420.1 hypothetical protein NXS98_04625 [Fontisphaera persica]
MTQPLVILVYERILPGSQLLNRFQDMGYRVLALNDPRLLVETARREGPLLAVVDMPFAQANAGRAVAELRSSPDTQHVPVIAIVPAGDKELEQTAIASQATLVAHDTAILNHLDRFLQQALQLD